MNNLPKRSIIAGDFNVDHQAFNASDNPLNNWRGQSIFEAIDKNGLKVFNRDVRVVDLSGSGRIRSSVVESGRIRIIR